MLPLTKSWPQLVLMGLVWFGTQFPIDILSRIAWTSQAWFYLSIVALALQVSSALCSLPVSLYLVVSYPFFLSLYVSCSLSIHGLKPICPLTIHFLFCLFELPTIVRFEFPSSASSPLCNISHGGGNLSSHELRATSSKMIRYFSYVVKWFIHQLSNQIKLKTFIWHSLFLHQI